MSHKRDHYASVLQFIDQVLMGEDVEKELSMFHQCSALQAAEQSFYDVLCEKQPHDTQNTSNHEETASFLDQSYLVDQPFEPNFHSSHHSTYADLVNRPVYSPVIEFDGLFVSRKQEKVNQQEDQRRKQFACNDDGFEPTEIYEVLGNEPKMPKTPMQLLQHVNSKEVRAKRAHYIRQDNNGGIMDLPGMLTQCAQAVQINDFKNANTILKQIRQHASPNGNSTQRLAHYFADAIEARMAGTGIEIYTAFNRKRISASDILKAHLAYFKVFPFHRMSNITADKSIMKLAKGVTTLHVIDFGILYGLQWPCLIHGLSIRPGGPPKFRVTGIDFPQPGFRPAERVEATGKHLARYCEKFNVPFEYNAIAKNWETIKLEDFKFEKGEMVVVNSLYRLRHVPDVAVDGTSPRDAVLDLIKRINPDLFVHGVVNGTYNAPVFDKRFKEAMFYFSSLFDMFEATEMHKDKHRLLFEKEVFGRDAMNIIACEGSARIDRPETYQQWQFRNRKAGFRQLPFYKSVVKEVNAKFKMSYHKEFLVDEENNWMLQGWKGRVLYAISLWKPVQD